MQKSYYQYRKEECRIGIDRMPIWFKETEFDGDQNKGYIIFQTENEYDEIWGPNAKMEISWEKKGRTETFHAKEVQASIDMYNAIKVVVTKKEMIWLRTHDFTYWIGHRTKMIRKRYYPLNIIHGVFYCDITERVFNINTEVIKKHYEGFEPYIIEGYKSIDCHEG